jgi:hypothetical protein
MRCHVLRLVRALMTICDETLINGSTRHLFWLDVRARSELQDSVVEDLAARGTEVRSLAYPAREP